MSTPDGLLDLLKRVAALRRAPRTRKGRYPAARSPYKPLLLLSVLRRLQQQIAPFSNNRIEYDHCARDFSALYATLYGDTEKIDAKVAQAFWYLGAGTPRLWTLVPNGGQDHDLSRLITERAQLNSATRLKKVVDSASFAQTDWALVNDPDVQKALISFLVSEHFTDIRTEIARL